MNTERPDNDDAAEAHEAAEEKAASETASEDGRAREDLDGTEDAAGREDAAGSEDATGPEGTTGSEDAIESEDATGSEGTTGSDDATGSEVPGSSSEGAGTSDTPEAQVASEADEASETAETFEGAEASEPSEASAVGSGASAPATDPSGADAPDPDRDPDLDLARSARRRSPMVVASVAAAVLLVGGGGAYFAATASGGSGGSDDARNSAVPGSDGTPPPLALDDYAAAQDGGTNGIAPGEPNPYGVTYRAAGTLPDGPGSAPVYRAKGQVTEDEVGRLAKALGVDGKPVVSGQDWQVGPVTDGAGPTLRVSRQAPGAWTFHRYVPGTDSCKSTLVCAQDPANPAGDTVGVEAAKKAAAPVLKAVGQDDAKVDASQIMGAQRVVNADPVVGGLPTYGWTTGLTVSAQGEVVGGSGQLKAPVKSDSYPVLSAQKTLDEMNTAPADHRMGIGGCASPVPLGERLEAPCGSSTSTSAPKSSPAPTPTPAQNTITVDKAVFGLAMHAVDGRSALVPSWLFGVRASGAQNAFTVTHPAVDPAYLTARTPAAPSDEPTTSKASPRDVRVDGYTADGKELTVGFTGGVCADYKASASESAGKVTVTVTQTPWPDKVCIMIAKEFHRTVSLDEPLGDRKVMGADGKAIPLEKAGARLPATPEAR